MLLEYWLYGVYDTYIMTEPNNQQGGTMPWAKKVYVESLEQISGGDAMPGNGLWVSSKSGNCPQYQYGYWKVVACDANCRNVVSL